MIEILFTCDLNSDDRTAKLNCHISLGYTIGSFLPNFKRLTLRFSVWGQARQGNSLVFVSRGHGHSWGNLAWRVFREAPWAAFLQGFSQEQRTQTIPLLPPDPTPEFNRSQDYGAP